MSCEFQKDIKFDEIEDGDLVLVELFSEDGCKFLGDRRGTAMRRIGDTWYFKDMQPLYKEAKGYRLFRVTELVEESTVPTAELERLRGIEDGLKKLVGMRKQVADSLRAEADEWESMGAWQSAGFNRDDADKLMAEVGPLEALLGD